MKTKKAGPVPDRMPLCADCEHLIHLTSDCWCGCQSVRPSTRKVAGVTNETMTDLQQAERCIAQARKLLGEGQLRDGYAQADLARRFLIQVLERG